MRRWSLVLGETVIFMLLELVFLRLLDWAVIIAIWFATDCVCVKSCTLFFELAVHCCLLSPRGGRFLLIS